MDDETGKWAKLDSRLWENEKWRRFSAKHPAAAVLWVNAISYSADQLTDGRISGFVATRFLGATADDVSALVQGGFATRDGDGFAIHDYAVWNRTAKQVDEMRKARSKAGRRGAMARWHPDGAETVETKRLNGKRYGNRYGKQIADTDTYTDTYTDTDADKDADKFTQTNCRKPQFREDDEE